MVADDWVCWDQAGFRYRAPIALIRQTVGRIKSMGLKLIQQTVMGLNQQALDEWIEYRRKYSKKAMSQPAVDKVINKLLQWSESEQQRMVDEAIEHEWTGLHYVEPPKEASGRNTRDMSIEECLFDTSWAKQ